MNTKILIRKSLSKKDRSYVSLEQNHWWYLIPTFRFNSGYKQFLREISLMWLFWEISIFFDHMPQDNNNTQTIKE